MSNTADFGKYMWKKGFMDAGSDEPRNTSDLYLQGFREGLKFNASYDEGFETGRWSTSHDPVFFEALPVEERARLDPDAWWDGYEDGRHYALVHDAGSTAAFYSADDAQVSYPEEMPENEKSIYLSGWNSGLESKAFVKSKSPEIYDQQLRQHLTEKWGDGHDD